MWRPRRPALRFQSRKRLLYKTLEQKVVLVSMRPSRRGFLKKNYYFIFAVLTSTPSPMRHRQRFVPASGPLQLTVCLVGPPIRAAHRLPERPQADGPAVVVSLSDQPLFSTEKATRLAQRRSALRRLHGLDSRDYCLDLSRIP